MATTHSNLLETKKASAFFQNACLQHRFIRSKDTSNIVERPERLRAVSIGLAAAIARLEEAVSSGAPNQTTSSSPAKQPDPNDLAEVMGRMKLEHDSSSFIRSPVSVVQSQATINILNNPAVKFIHGDIEGDVYLENLKAWAKGSSDKVLNNESEIPEHLSQGDLYRRFFAIFVTWPK
jgi:histone deacetylase HOS3